MYLSENGDSIAPESAIDSLEHRPEVRPDAHPIRCADLNSLRQQPRSLSISARSGSGADRPAGADDPMPWQRVREFGFRQEPTDQPRVARPADSAGEHAVGANASPGNRSNQATEPQYCRVRSRHVVHGERWGWLVSRSTPELQLCNWVRFSLRHRSRRHCLTRISRSAQVITTGLIAGLPFNTATTFSAAISDIRVRVETVAEPMCGSTTTLSNSSSSDGIAGSPS